MDSQNQAMQPIGAWEKEARLAIASDSPKSFERIDPRIKADSLIQSAAGSVGLEFALAVAIRELALHSFRWLVESAAQDHTDIGALVSSAKCSMLHEAADIGSVEMARALLPFCDVNARDPEGQSALSWAAVSGNDEVVLELLPLTDPNARGDDGASALMNAAANVEPQTLRAMARLIDPKAVALDGSDALMWAVYWGRLRAVEALLPLSDCSRRNNEGQSAFDIARASLISDQKNLWEILDLLALTAPEPQAQQAFETLAQSSPEKMPRWAARKEARALAESVAEAAAKTTPQSAAPTGEPQNAKPDADGSPTATAKKALRV